MRWGQVYRSAQLNNLTAQGVSTLAALNIKTVVDLRFSGERESYPTTVGALPNAEILSWHEEKDQLSAKSQIVANTKKSNKVLYSWKNSLASKNPAVVREAMRSNYPQKLYSHRTIYRQMLLRLSDGKSPLIFHCAAGKDRTGVAAALILSLLGVDDQQIVDDYLLTQNEIEGQMGLLLAAGAATSSHYQDFQRLLTEQPEEMLKPVFDADPIYISTLLEYVTSTYGSFTEYAKQRLEIGADIITALRHQLLE